MRAENRVDYMVSASAAEYMKESLESRCDQSTRSHHQQWMAWGRGRGKRGRTVLFGLLALDLTSVSPARCVAPMSTVEVPWQQRRTFVRRINEERSKEHMGFSKCLLPYDTKGMVSVDRVCLPPDVAAR